MSQLSGKSSTNLSLWVPSYESESQEPKDSGFSYYFSYFNDKETAIFQESLKTHTKDKHMFYFEAPI